MEQDPVVLVLPPYHVISLPFVENVSQGIIREVRNAEPKTVKGDQK